MMRVCTCPPLDQKPKKPKRLKKVVLTIKKDNEGWYQVTGDSVDTSDRLSDYTRDFLRRFDRVAKEKAAEETLACQLGGKVKP